MGFQVYNSSGQELRSITGTAGGDLTGTYPNPTLVSRRLDYQSRTTNYTVSATSVGAAAEVFATDLSFTADGTSTYVIEVQLGVAWYAGTNGYNLYAILCKGDGTAVATIGQISDTDRKPGPFFRYPYVPAAGTETFNVRLWKEAGGSNGTLDIETGTAGRTVAGLAYIAAYKL